MTYSILSNANGSPEFTKFKVTEEGIKLITSMSMYNALLDLNNPDLTQILTLKRIDDVEVTFGGDTVSFTIYLPFLGPDRPHAPATVYPDFQKLNRAAEALSILTQSIAETFRTQAGGSENQFALNSIQQQMFLKTFTGSGYSSYNIKPDLNLELSPAILTKINLLNSIAKTIVFGKLEKDLFKRRCLLTEPSWEAANNKVGKFDPIASGLEIRLYGKLFHIKVPNASGGAQLLIDQANTGCYTGHNLDSSLDLIVMTMAIIGVCNFFRDFDNGLLIF